MKWGYLIFAGLLFGAFMYLVNGDLVPLFIRENSFYYPALFVVMVAGVGFTMIKAIE